MLATGRQAAELAERIIACQAKGRLEAVTQLLMGALLGSRPDLHFALALALAEAGLSAVADVREMAQSREARWCPTILDPHTGVVATPDDEPMTAPAAAVRLLDAVHRQDPFDIAHVFEQVSAGDSTVFVTMFAMLTEYASIGRQGKIEVSVES